MSSLIFDIETEPIPADELRPLFDAQYTPLAHPGEFDPSSVKYGNTKDAVKREEKLAAAEVAHKLLVEQHEENAAADYANRWQLFVNDAALSPHTGRVLAIGMMALDSSAWAITDGDECDILAAFWAKYSKCRASNRRLIGHNILQFDLPFLIRRSWVHQIDIPSTVRDGRYFDRLFVDTREVYLLGQRWGECPSSLNDVARFLGVGSKPDGVNGGDFGRLYRGSPEEREQAVAYLKNDLEMTAGIARRMGV